MAYIPFFLFFQFSNFNLLQFALHFYWILGFLLKFPSISSKIVSAFSKLRGRKRGFVVLLPKLNSFYYYFFFYFSKKISIFRFIWSKGNDTVHTYIYRIIFEQWIIFAYFLTVLRPDSGTQRLRWTRWMRRVVCDMQAASVMPQGRMRKLFTYF